MLKFLETFLYQLINFQTYLIHRKEKKLLNNLNELDGIGNTQINSINTFFTNQKNIEVIKDLVDVLQVKNYQN